MKMLLDRSTDALARIFEFTSKPLAKTSPIQGNLIGIVPKHVGSRAKFIAEERGALLSLVRLTSAEFLHSCISFDEGIRVARWPDLSSQLDIFSYHGLSRLNWATLPFDFAKIPGFYGDNINDTDRYRNILAMAGDPLFFDAALRHQTHFGFSDEELRNLRAFSKVAILAGPQREHLIDLFQLWTAEINRIPYFLTCDNTFVRFMTLSMKSPFTSLPIAPSELCKVHGISYSPLQCAHPEDFYTMSEVPLKEMIEAHDRGEGPPRSYQTITD